MKASSLQKFVQLSLLLSFVFAIQSIHGRSQGSAYSSINEIASNWGYDQENPQEVLNTLLDSVFIVLVKNMNKTIPLPDFQETLHEKFGFMSLTAKITAKDGVMGDITTIQRKGDTNLSPKGDTLTAKIVIGFQELYATYNKCVLDILGTRIERVTKVTIGENTADIQIHLTKNLNQCSIKLDHFLLTKFENIQIKIIGKPGVLNWMTSKIITFFVNSFRRNIKKRIESGMSKVLTEQLKEQETTICALFE